MSILACLGNEAEAIRDMYLARLQANTEVRVALGLCVIVCVCDCMYVWLYVCVCVCLCKFLRPIANLVMEWTQIE